MKRYLLIAGVLLSALVVVLVYRATKLVKDLSPRQAGRTPSKQPAIAKSRYHSSIKIYGAKYHAPAQKKGANPPKGRPWVGKKPNLPSHKELMRRVRQFRTYPRNLPKVAKPGSEHYRIQRSAFKAWLKKPLAENGARFVPNFRGGRPQGMRVSTIEPGSFYERLGLYKNDILLSINGRNVYTPGHALKHYKRVASKYRNLILTFKRGGKTHTVDFDLLSSPKN